MDKLTFLAEFNKKLEEAKKEGKVRPISETPMGKFKEALEKAKAEGKIKPMSKTNPLLTKIKELKQIKDKEI